MASDPLINNPQYHKLTEEQIHQKKRRARRTLVWLIASLIGLTALEVFFLKQAKASIAENINILFLFNIIIILLVLLIVMITRNLVKLYNERKSRIIGAKFQTKLIFAFFILALVPATLLFFVASKLFSYSIGNWFSIQVERSLQQSMEVAREYYAHVEQKSQFHARKLEELITKNQLYLQERRDTLQRLVEAKTEEYELGGVIVYDQQGQVVVSYANPSMPQNYTNLDYADLIRESMENEATTEMRSQTKGNYLVVVLPLKQMVEGKPAVWGYILTLSKIPKSTIIKIEGIRNTFEDYKKQSFLKLPVSANYYITFILVTLLILFSAIWLGFYMARGITIPIQQLAAGTRRVAEGDLNVKVNLKASDEIGLLVDSFNTMTEQLKTSRKTLEEAHENLQITNLELDQRRNYTETILENIGAGVIYVDKKGWITTLNKGAKRLLNAEDKEIIGHNYKDVFDPSFHEPIRKMIKKMNEERKESYEEQVELSVGENNLTLLANIKIMRDDHNKYLGLLMVFEDVTQLIKAQKISAWQEVAQGIAHEIKNPLTPIQLNTQRLRKKYYEDKKSFAKVFDESIRIITQEVEGMKDLLNEFLRFSRMPTPHPKLYSVHTIIDDVTRLYINHEKGVTINKFLDPSVNLLYIDPEQIRRVFINLFDNALDALEEDGIIEISTHWDHEAKRVKIDFSDNGVGINPTDREKLFLPHFTTKKRGTGLGLAIVTRIINDHNGTIQVRSNEPRGTTFTLEFPDPSTTTHVGPFKDSATIWSPG
ncbi:MAG: ATP-binding protein [Nitrospinota bacterium]|nr:ATP-binding protein [Nitrospinota bacterium]